MRKQNLIIAIAILVILQTCGSTSGAGSGSTSNNTSIIWDTDQTLISDYTIREGETLVIKAGVTIYLDQDVSIFVYGTLGAEGTSESPITFTSKDSNEYWGVIKFGSTSIDANCSLRYCKIEYATQGIYCDFSSPGIYNCEILYSKNMGVYLYNSSATISNSTISSSDNMGIYCYMSSPSILGSMISSNTNIGIYSHLSAPAIYDSTILSNGNIGLYFDSSNPIINHNNIYNNTAYGIYNAKPSMVINATNNYWGSASGPGGKGPGSGDKISDGVMYAPWLWERLNLRPPTCSIVSPSENDVLKGMVTISGNASDVDSDVVKVEVKIDNEGVWEEANGTLDWTYLFDATNVTDGNYVIYAKAYDGIHYSDIISLSVRIDNPPVVIINEESQTVNTSSFLMSWSTNATDIQYYEIKISGNQWINVGTNTSYTFVLSEGENTLYVRGIDNGDNIGAEDSIIVTYEKQGKALTFPLENLLLVIIVLFVIFLFIVLLVRRRWR